MALWFEIVMLSLSSKLRVDSFVEKIDMDNHNSFKIYRETYVTKNKHVKDLSLLGRKLSTIIIFDSNPVTQARQPSNAISIK